MVCGMTSRIGLLLALALALPACQSGREGGAGNAFRADLEKICNAKQLSGADQETGGQATYLLAQWLNTNVTSTEGHAFLVEFAKLGQDKPARRKKLEGAVAQLGLAGCPLVDDWR